jgi:hypothetical protein
MKINNTKFTKNSEIYIKEGYYDARGQYNVLPFEKAEMRYFYRKIRRHLLTNLNNGYLCNALILPAHRRIVVILPAGYTDKFEQQVEDDEVKALLDFHADYDVPNGYLLWAHCNFPKE